MSLYEINVNTRDGGQKSLADYKDQVLLIVNTATECGFTPQYAGLQALYDKYRARGFRILDFPCNQFAGQAPGTAEEIHTFCIGRFGITFEQFAKIDVNGANESPLFAWLKAQKKGILGDAVKWNFTKFLIDRHGEVVARFAPTTAPETIEKQIEALLQG
jgi:glutathione peroxidase